MCADKRKSPASKESKKLGKSKKSKVDSDASSNEVSASESGSDKEFDPKAEKSETEENLTDDELPGFVKNDAGEYYMKLSGSGERRVTVRTFKGHTYIDFREFYEKDGKYLPGKKGISLTKDQWISIRDSAKQIDDCINKI